MSCLRLVVQPARTLTAAPGYLADLGILPDDTER